MMISGAAASSCNVYIAGADAVWRGVVSDLLTGAGFRVTGFASIGDFLKMASSLRPGALVAEMLPDSDATQLLSQVGALQYHFPTILMTLRGDVKSAVRAIKAGAIDYLDSPADEEIVSAIRLAQRRLEDLKLQELSKDATTRVSLLSAREYEVLERLVAGMPTKVIARELEISPRTVEFHRSHIMAKMGAANLAELIRLGLVAGIKMQREPGADI